MRSVEFIGIYHVKSYQFKQLLVFHVCHYQEGCFYLQKPDNKEAKAWNKH